MINKLGCSFIALMHICRLPVLDMCIRGDGSCESLQEKQSMEYTKKGMEIYGRVNRRMRQATLPEEKVGSSC